MKFRTNFEGYFGRLLTHRFSEPMQINMFIDGLRPHTRQLFDAFMGGKIKLETPEVVMELGNMVASDEAIHRDRTFIPAKKNLLAKQIEALTDKLNNLPQQLHVVQPTQPSNIQVGGCTLCGGAHEVGLCMIQDEANKELNYMASVSPWQVYQFFKVILKQ